MTAIPHIPLPKIPKEEGPAADIIRFKGTARMREHDTCLTAAEGRGERSRIDGNASSFKKIFQEKKAERETAVLSEKIVPQAQEANRKTESAAAAAGRAFMAIRNRLSAPQADKKHSAVKRIFAVLIEKNTSAKKPEKRETKKKTADGVLDIHPPARAGAAGERLDKSERKNDAARALNGALSELHKEKEGRQVVIVDLRDRPNGKTKAIDGGRGASFTLRTAENEQRETNKLNGAKEGYETKVLAKATLVPDRFDGTTKPVGNEYAAPKGEYSSPLADVMRNDIVKHAGLVLKNGGGGEINLVLKPESLGSVRIRLNLDDNHIVGKIIVDNNIVKQIVEENLGHLETALQENGYQAAAFDVSVAGEKRNTPEEGTVEHGGPGGVEASSSAVEQYETSGEVLYADALVNIVL